MAAVCGSAAEVTVVMLMVGRRVNKMEPPRKGEELMR